MVRLRRIPAVRAANLLTLTIAIPYGVSLEILHHDQLAEHGGLHGIRDDGALESALGRPRNRWLYDQTTDLTELAAAYAFGVVRSHPFVDGNKRMAFIALAVFLDLNGSALDADETDVVTTMRALASGELSEDDLADWVRTRQAQR